MGTGFDVNISGEDQGIVPRAVAHLFDGIDKRVQLAKENGEPPPDFKVNVQFMEVHVLGLYLCHKFKWGSNLNTFTCTYHVSVYKVFVKTFEQLCLICTSLMS